MREFENKNNPYLNSTGKVIMVGNKPTVHIVHLLDNSTSMWGPRHASSVQGMVEEINLLKEDDNVEYLYTVVQFSGSSEYIIIFDALPLSSITDDILKRKIKTPSGMTALHDAIGKTIDKLLKRSNENIIMKIFTDGGENNSRSYTAKSVKELISNMEGKDHVVSFVGTHTDVVNVIKTLSIDAKNTLSYDGTARGLKDAYTHANNATIMYSKSLIDGTADNRSFFSNSNNNNSK